MRPRTLAAALATLVAAAVAAGPAAAATPYTVRTLHFDVAVGPQGDTHCDVIGDLYRPADATPAHPEPAVLTTNGFGGSKDDQAQFAKQLAANGYVVLSYSGLGFGGSGCKIQLDDPDWDGKAASQLISFLGGSKTATDGTRVDYVVHDAVAHDGSHRTDDPRVGMLGGSYGGQVQFAAAGVDPRLDTIIPIITWNDLAYSLTPNNTDLLNGVTSSTPGVLKFEWALLFTAEGAIVDGLQGAQTDPGRLGGVCPNFDARVCREVGASLLGAPTPGLVNLLRHASVASYIDKIRIPTMLWQGEHDSLFNLNESVATYDALRARHVPVKLVWQSWGHSAGKPAPGEFTFSGDLAKTYEGQLAEQWLGYYLKDQGAAPQQDFSYYRNWVSYKGDAAPAYAHAPAYPSGAARQLYLSSGNLLASSRDTVRSGLAAFAAAAAAPVGVSEISALSGNVTPAPSPVDAPGTYAAYATAPLSENLDVAGIPSVTLHVSAPASAASSKLGANGLLTLYIKLYDVAPDGGPTLPAALLSPVRVADPSKPVRVQLPGIVHRFAKGHRLELVIAGADSAYRGSPVAHAVTITTDRANPGVLSLPVATESVPAAVPAPQRACGASAPLRVHLHAARHERIVSATAYVGGRAVKRVHGRRLTVLHLRAPRAKSTIRIVTVSNRGSRRTIVVRSRGC
jgi:ABC-2 type transport system ATP-binding protein